MAPPTTSVSYRSRRLLGITEVRREKMSLASRRLSEITWAVMKHRMGGPGVAILAFFIGMALAAPFLTSLGIIADPEARVGSITEPSSWAHPFGTDHNGKHILARVIHGSRISLLVGLLASVIASILGTIVGLVSGFYGRWVDESLMRVNDILLSLPWLALLIVLAAILGGQLTVGIIIVAIGLTSWNFAARVVRPQVLSVKERAFIERAKAAGAGDIAILRKHIFPNVFPLVFANTILTVAVAILSESSLAFLGRVDPRSLSWGVILFEAEQAGATLNGWWSWIVIPGLALVFVILGFSLLGYALDEVLNPRLR